MASSGCRSSRIPHPQLEFAIGVTGDLVWSPALPHGEPIVSFSQNAEDVRLWRVFQDVDEGFYVDVGAGDPEEYSVTKLFYDRGWSGINVEPGPAFNKLEVERPRDLNLNLAVAAAEEAREFWISAPHSGLSTDSRGLPFRAPRGQVHPGFRNSR
jgi:hypothetical protein